jgi:methylase of polypeptide subunit release factors
MRLCKLLLEGKLLEQLTEECSEDAKMKRKKKSIPVPALKILDVCSGTGCISLLLHHQLSRHFQDLKITGLDISPTAVALSNENLRRNLQKGILEKSAIGMVDHKIDKRLESAILSPKAPQIQFIAHDIFDGLPKHIGPIDIIISNPPYISKAKFNTETTRSVRNWEPKLALVPELPSLLKYTQSPSVATEDIFYYHLLSIYQASSSKVLLMEVGDEEQAVRVVKLALRDMDIEFQNRIEIWRDWSDSDEIGEIEINGYKIPIKGAGKVRAVVFFRMRDFELPQKKLPPIERLEELSEESQ